MKTTVRLALFTGLLLATAPLSRAQDAAQPAAPPATPKLVRVQVEFVDLSQQQLTELMFGEHPTTNDTELRKQVGHLVAQNKASIMSVNSSGPSGATSAALRISRRRSSTSSGPTAR
jgi:hypothetical protein